VAAYFSRLKRGKRGGGGRKYIVGALPCVGQRHALVHHDRGGEMH